MGGFSKFTDLAQQVAGKDQAKTDQQQPQQGSSSQTTATNDQKWVEVGSAAKKAFAGFQTDQAGGKGPDYTEIGVVAQRAFTAYNDGSGGEEGGKRDLTEIGKGIAAGFGGDGAKDGSMKGIGGGGEMEEGKVEGTDNLMAAKGIGEAEDDAFGGGQRTKIQDGDDGDLAVSVSKAEDTTTGLASKKLSGGELDSSNEKPGLDPHTGQDVRGDGSGCEKGGLGEDEGVFAGEEGKSSNDNRSGETTTGQGLGGSGQQSVGIAGDEEETVGYQSVKRRSE
ncbi:hypothetical protein CORC01_08911 [Colletotrichum orchidophilum]|uniref:Uncharacterized protein n=1 Tax=Colletotrichum orchidophilum TaxID=1209926 RepID=A0A1G4B2X2_9PEZI|nr:uncharacterized protein CORC01_08911 [Colletotrichum orchidophilum]OHE95770.1 hypothetical protein CORC01_08911 [Colletotrichum orchidophilum]